MNNKSFNYFRKGFNLVNKSWRILLFGLILTSLKNIPVILSDSFVKGTLEAMGFLLIFVEFGFFYSLPVFLLARQEGKLVSFGDIFSTSLQNTKRLILPLILIFIVFIILGVLGLFLVIQFVYGGNFDFMQNTAQGFNLWNLFYFVFFFGLFSFITFSPIYFSLEKNGLFRSFKKSINLSIKNLDFIIIIFMISSAIFLISTQFLGDYQSIWQLFLGNTIYQFEGLLFSATALILYQSQRE